jgi:hypothetical protein
VSNLKRFLLVFVQLMYYLLLIMLYRIGPISDACNSATLVKPLLCANSSNNSGAYLLIDSGIERVA